jgi:hypothetical protein
MILADCLSRCSTGAIDDVMRARPAELHPAARHPREAFLAFGKF